MLLCADDSPHSTYRESTATAPRCDCVCACVRVSLLLFFLVQCIHVKRTFSVNFSLFGAKVINHRVTAVVVLRAFVQVCLLWEQPSSESYKPALILLCRIKWTREFKDTGKKGSPVCPIYSLQKKDFGVLLAPMHARCGRACVQ